MTHEREEIEQEDGAAEFDRLASKCNAASGAKARGVDASRAVDLTMPPPQESALAERPVPSPHDYFANNPHELDSKEWRRSG